MAFHGGQFLISSDFLQPFEERFRFAGQAFEQWISTVNLLSLESHPEMGLWACGWKGILTEAGRSVHCGWYDALGWNPTLHGKEKVHRAQTFISAPRLQK